MLFILQRFFHRLVTNLVEAKDYFVLKGISISLMNLRHLPTSACNEAYRLLAFYNSNESSVSTHICKLPSRYNLAYSSGSSTASEVNAQSDSGVVFKSFSASQQSILSPYCSINYLRQKLEAFQSVHHVTFILCYTVLYVFLGLRCCFGRHRAEVHRTSCALVFALIRVHKH